ncbi:MAG: hypothetical protein OXP37_10670 [Chloroflexota bacterium]|nr:hypothetical protein [Chloroflexota bacterium]
MASARDIAQYLSGLSKFEVELVRSGKTRVDMAGAARQSGEVERLSAICDRLNLILKTKIATASGGSAYTWCEVKNNDNRDEHGQVRFTR